MLLALPDGTIALGVGTVLALGAAALVLGPLVTDEVIEPAASPASGAPRARERTSAIEALREIEFDRETGKLSDADYEALKTTYTREALAELRERDAARRAPVADDAAIERAIAGYRKPKHAVAAAVCPVDGTRPEPDALFCSTCGRFLAERCEHCGVAVECDDARFCTACGQTLGVTVAAA